MVVDLPGGPQGRPASLCPDREPHLPYPLSPKVPSGLTGVAVLIPCM